jgi:hypothetical protein
VSVEEPSGTEPGQEDEDADDDEVDAEDAFIDQSAVMLEETPESGDGQPSLISFEEEEKTSTSMAQTTED